MTYRSVVLSASMFTILFDSDASKSNALSVDATSVADRGKSSPITIENSVIALGDCCI